MQRFNQKGISIIEVLIVLAVLVLVFLVMIPQFSLLREKQVLKNSVRDILSLINKAQAKTLASVDSSSYGVHFKEDSITIFKGILYTEGNSENEIFLFTEPALISEVVLGGVSSSSGNLYFNRISGSPSKWGSIFVSTPSFSKTITISPTGSVSVN